MLYRISVILNCCPGNRRTGKLTIPFILYRKNNNKQIGKKRKAVGNNNRIIIFQNAIPHPNAQARQQDEQHKKRNVSRFSGLYDLYQLRQQGNRSADACNDTDVDAVIFHS